MIIKDNLNDIYIELSKSLVLDGLITNTTRELLNVSFELTDINNCLIDIPKSKKTSLKYLLAENIWFASGSNDVNFISKYAAKWAKITDDGKTSNSAYGYIIKHKYGFNQIYKVIDILSKDKESRRAIININNANENIDTTLDEECTMYLQYFIRNNKLYAITNMRSNDIWFGLPYDVPAFIAIQKFIADLLGIECGSYIHNAGSLHVYNEYFEKICYAASAMEYNLQEIKIDWVKLYMGSWIGKSSVLYNLANNTPEKLVDFCKGLRIVRNYV